MAPHLTALAVKDLALVSALELELGAGLTVLTGETGAGKSMLVDALLAATGGRVDGALVREGAEKARVDATFAAIAGHEVAALLGERDLADAGEDVLVLSREIAAGRAPARVNRRSVPLSLLAEIGDALALVHGQGEQSRLARPAVQRDLLDAYGAHGEHRARTAERAGVLAALRRERAALGGDPRERTRRADLLAHEVREIEDARIREGEDDELRRDLAVARSAERLRGAAASAHDLLVGERLAAHDRLAVAARELAVAAELDPRLAAIAERVAAQVEETADLGSELRRYAESVEADPERLASLDARDVLLGELRRKYGGTLAEVTAYGARAAGELAALRSAEERLARLDAEEAAARSALADAASALHDARAKAATALSGAVEAELGDLGLPHCRFRVTLEAQEPDASGADRVRFLIAPNPGEPAAPLEQSASGGELSRIMLALEVVLAAHEATPVLVFDEVDAGVGGRLGEVLGRKLWSLARHHQVLCVSHLPQVAAYADRHVRVRKEVARGRTHVIAETLDEDGIVAELAAMLGAGGGAASLAAGARELRVAATAWKSGGLKSRKRRP